MKKTLTALTLAFFAMTAHANISVANSTDGILAKVNDEVVLKSELLSATQALAREYRDNGINASLTQIQNQALDNLITRKLQLGLVRRAGFIPNEDMINTQLLKVAQSQGLNSLEQLQATLDARQKGAYAELRNQFIEEASLVALWQSQVRPRINISAEEVRAFLLSPEGQALPQERVLLPEWQTSHILAKVDDSQNSAMAEQKINALYTQLQQGADFANLASTYSDDTGSAMQNGRLGWVNEGQMVPEFEAMMKKTEAGDFSTPFRTQFGWHILKVDNTRQRNISFEARQEKAREILFNRQAPQAEEDWISEIKAGAYIELIK